MGLNGARLAVGGIRFVQTPQLSYSVLVYFDGLTSCEKYVRNCVGYLAIYRLDDYSETGDTFAKAWLHGVAGAH